MWIYHIYIYIIYIYIYIVYIYIYIIYIYIYIYLFIYLFICLFICLYRWNMYTLWKSNMACWKIHYFLVRWFSYWNPISRWFAIATFDYRRVNIIFDISSIYPCDQYWTLNRHWYMVLTKFEFLLRIVLFFWCYHQWWPWVNRCPTTCARWFSRKKGLW